MMTIYLVSIEDGEIVKMTSDGFESTGMFVADLTSPWAALKAPRPQALSAET
jgi:hypothetical protein